MREGEGQTNEPYFEKSNEKDSQEGARMLTIPKQAIPRGKVFLPISHRRCKNLSLSLSSLCCKENHRCCNLSRKNLDRKSEL